jgi:hypothetical protein
MLLLSLLLNEENKGKRERKENNVGFKERWLYKDINVN